MAQLARAKVYRNVEMRQQWFGLEVLDVFLMGIVAWALLTFNGRALGWNLVVLVGAYVFLRVAKRGKPEGYVTSLLRFYVRKPHFSAAAPDRVGAAHPFPFPNAPAVRRHRPAAHRPRK
jgi:hypothetical protein